MQRRRGVRGWCVLVAVAGAVGACETARNPGGVLVDRISPTIALSAADTQQIANGLQFSVDASDNLGDRKSTRLNSSHSQISYAVFCLKKKKKIIILVSRKTSHEISRLRRMSDNERT